MLDSEKIALAARIHVMLRRVTGRVTDTEWMASNAEYAHEIVRFMRASAREKNADELLDWAAKLESALGLAEPMENPRTSVQDPEPVSKPAKDTARYLRGIR